MSIISTRLKELRFKNKYTQDYVALQMHIGRSTYTHWETGKYMPDLDKLICLCNFYKVSADYMLGLTDSCTDKNNSIKNEFSDTFNTNENEKITSYYNRLNEENRDYIRGEMVKLYREQEDDDIESTNQKKIG